MENASKSASSTRTGTYVVDTDTGEGFSLGSGKIGKTIKAVVKFDKDGKIAWRGPTYWDGEQPRNFKANAGKMAKRFQYHYDKTGSRWEVEQERTREANRKHREEQRRKARQVRDAGPDLLEACQIARRIVAKAVKAGTEPDNVLRTLDAAIAKAVE